MPSTPARKPRIAALRETDDDFKNLPVEAKRLLASAECAIDRMVMGSTAIMQQEDGAWVRVPHKDLTWI